MFMHTSIFLPSTTVPCSLSRARSASALFANVTKPNPCMQGQTKQHALNSTYRLPALGKPPTGRPDISCFALYIQKFQIVFFVRIRKSEERTNEKGQR